MASRLRRAALRDALTLKILNPRSPRASTHGPRIIVALIKCWAVLRAPSGKRLAPMLPVLVPLLRRDGELDLTDAEAALPRQMSAAAIDRRLAGELAKMMPRGRSHAKAGSLLQSHIPMVARSRKNLSRAQDCPRLTVIRGGKTVRIANAA